MSVSFFLVTDAARRSVQHLFFKDSPYWTFLADGIDGLTIRFSSIEARRDNYDGHDVIDMTAFNTDGACSMMCRRTVGWPLCVSAGRPTSPRGTLSHAGVVCCTRALYVACCMCVVCGTLYMA